MEATEENKEKLIDEIHRLASTARGKTATEEKIRKVRDFAKEHNVELVTEMPEGWENIGGMTSPKGSTWISNMESYKSGRRKKTLLLIL